ncbi:VOC family protein [Candidatus Entotheonella palauensis]|uniref:Glyoxalase n=1 Tax=Candidatus Entotheonella gemina TaxID=1429439 RepID=W4M5E7_9BACT|nr:VOC family protein [Candidatus Entotheonella palauensis]ETX04842.1 MAG: glyoxalase [Candidatus Entotheonella gemina]
MSGRSVRKKNETFELRGVNHLALVCKDMAKTVDFYEGILGMPLIKTIELRKGLGQHFFFDIGNGDSLAFFWFPDAPEAHPGVASPAGLIGETSITTAHGSMNHIAFDVPLDKIEAYREKLVAKGVKVTEVINHDDTEQQISAEVNETTMFRSIYFLDPDGIMLEFCAWAREPHDGDVQRAPATAVETA